MGPWSPPKSRLRGRGGEEKTQGAVGELKGWGVERAAFGVRRGWFGVEEGAEVSSVPAWGAAGPGSAGGGDLRGAGTPPGHTPCPRATAGEAGPPRAP